MFVFDGIFLTGISLVAFSLILLIRNEWVYKKRIKWLDLIYNHNMELIKERKFDSVVPYQDFFVPYGFMILKFWVWDETKFINDVDSMSEIIETNKIIDRSHI